jgi:methylphosphotriester-DNA--protein-cysteine methyltransferase
MLVAMQTHALDTSEDQGRYRAIRRRDPLADGNFFYSVKTTGVY